MGIHQMLLSYGSSGAKSAYLVDKEYTRFDSSPCGLKVATDGKVYAQQTASYTTQYTWLTGSGTSTDYQVRFTPITGSVTSGTINTWTTISTDQSWTRGATAGFSGFVTGTVEIRDASTLSVLASATVTIICDREGV